MLGEDTACNLRHRGADSQTGALSVARRRSEGLAKVDSTLSVVLVDLLFFLLGVSLLYTAYFVFRAKSEGVEGCRLWILRLVIGLPFVFLGCAVLLAAFMVAQLLVQGRTK
jgi:hypothetical protein